MQRLLSIVLIFTISICVLPAVATAQTGKSIPADVIQQLLNRPALPFGVSRNLRDDQIHSPDELPSETNPPADDASIDEITDYWLAQPGAYNRNDKKPSAMIRQRLLEECENNPFELEMLLPLLPDTSETAERVKGLLDADKANPVWGPQWQQRLEEWLRLNSTFYIDDLAAQASKAKDGSDGILKHQTELTALARLDWKSALPILQKLSNTDQQVTRAFSISLLYKHAIDSGDSSQSEEYRTILTSIAETDNHGTAARIYAAKALVTTEWNGRDEWYLSMLKNGTLWDLLPGMEGSPLFAPVSRDPDKWIPVMTELVASKDANIHNSAVASLAQLGSFGPDKARIESLLPLLPWLQEEKWAVDVGPGRRNLIRWLGKVQIPESIPGLISIATDGGSSEIRVNAVVALAQYKDPRIAPALKIALEKETERAFKPLIIKSLIAVGGLTDQEMVDDLEACVRLKCEDQAGIDTEQPGLHTLPPEIPSNILIGQFISTQFQPSDSFSRNVLDRINVLQDTDPVVAGRLVAIVSKWRTNSINVDLIRRIAAGRADAEMIETALSRATKLREIAGSELAALTELKGVNRAIGLVLIDDDLGMQDVLSSSDKESIITVLSCARLAGKLLPVDRISDLFQRNDEKLSSAAERYLEAEDSIDARHLLWARHADQAWIVGWKASSVTGSPGNDSSSKEKRLRTEVLKDGGPNEIFAFFPDFIPGEMVVRIWNDKAVLTFLEAKDRYKEWQLSPIQLQEIKDHISAKNLEQVQSTFNGCFEGCRSMEFVDVTRGKGWRIAVQVNGPLPRFPQSIIGLIIFISKIIKGDDFKVSYGAAKDIPGLEVLFANDKRSVTAVWKQGQDFRLLIEKKVDPEEVVASARSRDDEDDTQKSPEEIRKEQQRLLEMERDKFTWYKFQDGKLGETTVDPQESLSADDNTRSIDPLKFPAYQNANLRRATAGNIAILASGNTGLWKKTGQQPPVQIVARGTYSNIVVDGGGHWAIALKEGVDEKQSIATVRVNLQTGKEYKVTFADGDTLFPLQYLASRDRVLVFRRIGNQPQSLEDRGEEIREYLLIDLATGKVQPAHGDFRFFQEQGERLPQSTGRPDEVWVAIPNRGAERTEVGRYNTITFKFDSVMTVPKFVFTSSNMWVDEAEGKLYIINGGDLLRVPLPLPGK